MNSYNLSRNFIDYAFENPTKIKPIHYAIYFFAIEHCNRLGWKKEFGLPTTMTMEAIGVRSYNTYSKALFELVEYGFICMLEKSKNQYSSNIIALSNFNKALDKALDKAFIKHTSKQSESTHQSIVSINKQVNNKQVNNITNKQKLENFYNFRLNEYNNLSDKQKDILSSFGITKPLIRYYLNGDIDNIHELSDKAVDLEKEQPIKIFDMINLILELIEDTEWHNRVILSEYESEKDKNINTNLNKIKHRFKLEFKQFIISVYVKSRKTHTKSGATTYFENWKNKQRNK